VKSNSYFKKLLIVGRLRSYSYFKKLLIVEDFVAFVETIYLKSF